MAPSQSPLQVADDQQLAQESAQDPGLAQLEAMKVPAPAISGGWPTCPWPTARRRGLTEFVTGLSRRQLLPASRDRRSARGCKPKRRRCSSPASRPAPPTKSSIATVLDPGLVQVAGPPIATASQWAANARSGVRQTVSDLLIQSDPGWQQVISSGWQPPDARTAVIDVSGLLTCHAEVSKTTITHFTMAVGTGSARWHPGYGTAEVDEWQCDRSPGFPNPLSGCNTASLANLTKCLTGVTKGAAADAFSARSPRRSARPPTTPSTGCGPRCPSATAIRLGGTAFHQLLAVALAVAAVVAVGIFVAQMAVSALRRDPGGISRAVGGLFVMGLGGGRGRRRHRAAAPGRRRRLGRCPPGDHRRHRPADGQHHPGARLHLRRPPPTRPV